MARDVTSRIALSSILRFTLTLAWVVLSGCSVIKGTYRATKGTVKGTVWAVKGAYKLTAGTAKLTYKIGKFTFKVVRAPLAWSLMNDDIETIDGLPPKQLLSVSLHEEVK